jgi:hypothetical protein
MHIEKAKNNRLLHQKLQPVASHLIGLDTNESAVHSLREFGITDLVCGDVNDSFETLTDMAFEVILCCDVIEHVTNLDSLLLGCRRLMSQNTILLITTINATALKPVLRAFFSREAVHPDHVAYFSLATLGALLNRYHFQPVAVGTFLYPAVTMFSTVISRLLAQLAPFVADGILVTAKLQD